MIIEWNAHMFSRDVERYPWHPHAAYRPDPGRLAPDPLADYLDRMAHAGIDRAVLVHPEPYGDDHRLILECLAREPDRLRGACMFFPADQSAPDKLAALVAREPRIVALRFHAHRGKEQYLSSFAEPGVQALWRRAAELNLTVELHVGPNYAAQLAGPIGAFPQTPVLIDHLAEPRMGDAVEYADVLALARFENVFMKLSNLAQISSAPPPHPDIERFVRLVADTFGPDRLAWGGGAPEDIDALLGHWPVADRAKVKGANLAALLGFASG